MKLTIVDNTGRLSADPNTWPAELKQAIEQCCCGQSSSSSSPPGPPQPIGCCPGILVPATLRGNIRNTISHDTGLSLRHVPALAKPDWIPAEAWPSDPVNDSGAWVSDLIFDYSGTVDVGGGFQSPAFPVFPPQGTVRFRYTYEVYYYVVLNLHPVFQSPNPCPLWLFQVCYPTGTMTYDQPAAPGFPEEHLTFPITWLNNLPSVPVGFLIRGIGGVAVPMGGGPPLNDRSIVSVNSASCVDFTAPVSCFSCSPFLQRGNWPCTFGSVPLHAPTVVGSEVFYDEALYTGGGGFTTPATATRNIVWESCSTSSETTPTDPLGEVFE